MTIKINPELEELPQEAREVAETAFNKIDSWIDEQVTALKKETLASIEASVSELKAEISSVEKSYQDSQKEIDTILAKIEGLSSNLATVNNKTVTDAIAATKDLATKLQTELKMREQKWKSLGEQAVNKAISTGTSILGIPPGVI